MIAANHPIDGFLAQGRDRLRSGGDNFNAVLGSEEPGEDREGLWEPKARRGRGVTHPHWSGQTRGGFMADHPSLITHQK